MEAPPASSTARGDQRVVEAVEEAPETAMDENVDRRAGRLRREQVQRLARRRPVGHAQPPVVPAAAPARWPASTGPSRPGVRAPRCAGCIAGSVPRAASRDSPCSPPGARGREGGTRPEFSERAGNFLSANTNRPGRKGLQSGCASQPGPPSIRSRRSRHRTECAAIPPRENRRFVLRSRPVPSCRPGEFRTSALPGAGPGGRAGAWCASNWRRCPPGRACAPRISGTSSGPFDIGELISCDTFGRVVESRCDALPVGAAAVGRQGWQDYAAVRPEDVSVASDAYTAEEWLTALSSPGQTPYLAYAQKARPMPGQTLAVTSAAGAVGSYAVQLGLSGGRAGGRDRRRTGEMRLRAGPAGRRRRGRLPLRRFPRRPCRGLPRTA